MWCGFLYYCMTGRLGCEHRWRRDAKPRGFWSLRIQSGPGDLGINMECISGFLHIRSYTLRRKVLDVQAWRAWSLLRLHFRKGIDGIKSLAYWHIEENHPATDELRLTGHNSSIGHKHNRQGSMTR